MLFKNLQELETGTLTPTETKECFKYLIKLIIHENGNEARDYTFKLAEAILRTMQEENRHHEAPKKDDWSL